MKRNVVLVDAGGANIGSVRYALERLGVTPTLGASVAHIRRASHLVLPGVGTAPHGMARLRDAGLAAALQTATQPLLGICLGMQLLFERSAEGEVECLGLLDGHVAALRGEASIRVPHIGWNRLDRCMDDALLDGIDTDAHAYFVHGYAAPTSAHTLASSSHGAPFSAIARRGNVVGMQFHPERSGAVGARLLENFLALS